MLLPVAFKIKAKILMYVDAGDANEDRGDSLLSLNGPYRDPIPIVRRQNKARYTAAIRLTIKEMERKRAIT